MDKATLIFLAASGVLAVVFIFFRQFKSKIVKVPAEKERPKISVVFIVKNNQKLLEHVLNHLLKMKQDIHEIVVLDLGSVDSSLDVARKLLGKDDRAKVFSILTNTLSAGYFNLIKNYVSNEMIFVIDLYKIGTNNPNVYVPDLFIPLDNFMKKNLPHPDSRISGERLLLFDTMEREKNSYVLKEHIIETLSNVRMRLESFSGILISDPKVMEEYLADIQDYLDKSIENITLTLRLIGPVNYSEKNLNDTMLSIIKDYGQSHKVTVKYKVLGSGRPFKESINNLLLGITQDLLYTILQHNLSSTLEITARYGQKKFFLRLKYKGTGNLNNLLSADNDLGHYVLQSIQNRLSLIDGKLRVKTKHGGINSLVLVLPLDQTTCIDRRGSAR